MSWLDSLAARLGASASAPALASARAEKADLLRNIDLQRALLTGELRSLAIEGTTRLVVGLAVAGVVIVTTSAVLRRVGTQR